MVDAFGGGAAMIIRMHHCLGDGIALARVMLSLTDSDPDAGIGPPIGPDDPGRRSLIARVADTTAGAIIGGARAGGRDGPPGSSHRRLAFARGELGLVERGSPVRRSRRWSARTSASPRPAAPTTSTKRRSHEPDGQR
jgi:hypothetical protein